jgi:hypothetical protein
MAKSTAYYPEQVSPFVQLGLYTKNVITGQGLVAVDTNPPFKKGGEIFTTPVQLSLDNMTGMTKITASTTLTPVSIDDSSIKVFSTMLGDAISTTDYETIHRGINANQQLGTQIGEYVAREVQSKLFKYMLDGVFGTAGALTATNVYDASSIGNTWLDLKAVNRARTVLGESGMAMDTLMVHSEQYKDLLEQGITMATGTVYLNGILTTGEVPMFMGYKVLINDTLCAPTDDVYNAYLVGGQPFYLGYQRNITLEQDRNILVGGGTDIVAFNVALGCAIQGVSYVSATMNPASSVLATPATWSLVDDYRNVKLIQIKTKVSE